MVGHLFSAQELTRQLQYGPDDAIDSADAAQTEEIVAGWLLDATEMDAFPDQLPPQIRAWALELGGIQYENPTSMERDQSGDISSGWRDRRAQILAAAKAWARRKGHTGTAPRSRGCFPPAVPLPDPARVPGSW